MAMAIGGDPYGIAPACRLLSVEFFLSWSGAVEWLLDNGANIINLSISTGSSHGKYTSNAAYLDNIIRNNSVLIVGSAGNRGDPDEGGDHKITNPKTAFNVITVGSTEFLGHYSPFSSYKTNFSISKPNLSAPAENFNVPGFMNHYMGTSASAAAVSGISAL